MVPALIVLNLDAVSNLVIMRALSQLWGGEVSKPTSYNFNITHDTTYKLTVSNVLNTSNN